MPFRISDIAITAWHYRCLNRLSLLNMLENSFTHAASDCLLLFPTWPQPFPCNIDPFRSLLLVLWKCIPCGVFSTSNYATHRHVCKVFRMKNAVSSTVLRLQFCLQRRRQTTRKSLKPPLKAKF